VCVTATILSTCFTVVAQLNMSFVKIVWYNNDFVKPGIYTCNSYKKTVCYWQTMLIINNAALYLFQPNFTVTHNCKDFIITITFSRKLQKVMQFCFKSGLTPLLIAYTAERVYACKVDDKWNVPQRFDLHTHVI